MSAPVHRAWTLLASLPSAEGAPWRTVDSWSSSRDHAARAREALGSPAESYPVGTCLRVVSPSGKMGRVHVVGADGRARPLVLPADAADYLGPLVRDVLYADPVAWWRESADGRYLLRVAGEAARRSGQGSPLHRAVVRAACDCAQDALPVWEARFPDDARPRTAIETTERWCDGLAMRGDVWAAAWAAAGVADGVVERAAAARAAAWAAETTRGAVWAALVALEAADAAVSDVSSRAWAAARAESLRRSAEHARRRIALPEVLAALGSPAVPIVP